MNPISDPEKKLTPGNGLPGKRTDNELLLDIFDQLYIIVSKIVRMTGLYLTILLVFIKRSSRYSISFGLTGLVLAATYFYFQKPYYESSVILSSGYFEDKLVSKAIDDLNKLCQARDDQQLASLLHLGAAQAGALRSFSVEQLTDSSEAETDYINQLKVVGSLNDEALREELKNMLMEDRPIPAYSVTVRTSEPGVFENLDRAIAGLFENNEFIVKKRNDRIGSLQKMQAKIYDELIKLDQLKTTYANVINLPNKLFEKTPLEQTGSMVLNRASLLDPLPVYRMYMRWYKEAVDIDEQIAGDTAAIKVVSGFTISTKPANMHFFPYGGIIGLLAGMCLGLLVAAFFSLRHYLRGFEERQLQRATAAVIPSQKEQDKEAVTKARERVSELAG